MQSCPKCECTRTTVVVLPKGMHYGKRVCAQCGQWIKWEPRPRHDWRELVLPIGRPHGLCVGLAASERQIKWAEQIRSDLMAKVRTLGTDYAPLVGAMGTIADSSWWIANKDKTVREMIWPGTWQPRELATV